VRDHPKPALALERRIELIAVEGSVGEVEVALGIEAEGINQDDRAAVEERALASVDLTENLARLIERDQLGA
jgi:hypothetical protein